MNKMNMVQIFLCPTMSIEIAEKLMYLVSSQCPHPKDAVFFNGKIYWLHLRIISKEDTLYSYTMWSLDIGLNKWASHAIHTGRIKRSMCLTIHQNQLIFLVNDGRTTIQSISEMEDLRLDACPVQEVHLFYIFGRYLRWTLLEK